GVPRWVTVLVLAPLPAALYAQGIGQGIGDSGSPIRVSPYFSVSETLTDNRDLRPQKRADAVTEASVGVRTGSSGGRVRGFLDYSLTGVVYANDMSASNVQNSLAASGTAEVIDRHGFIDVRASISQQLKSAFGAQSISSTPNNDNRSEQRTVSLTPYLIGQLGSIASYEARLNYSTTSMSGVSVGDSNSSSALLRLSSPSGPRLGWALTGNRQRSHSGGGRDTEDDRVDALVSYTPVPELMVGVTYGNESTDQTTTDTRSYTTYGAQLRWVPTDRSALQASFTHRFFGNAYLLSLSHRLAQGALALVSSRDLSTFNGQAGLAVGTLFDLFASNLPPGFDPVVLRDLLRARGLDPDAVLVARFATSSVTLSRLNSLVFSLSSVRTTYSMSVSQSNSEAIESLSSTAGTSFASTSEVRQRGLSFNVSHRLTPVSNLTAALSWSRTSDRAGALESTLKALIGNWTTTLGPNKQLSAGLRRQMFTGEGTASSYNENAIFATYRQQF
ncbi:MAG TPA: TIGR03016 family PEP-CTERM system-associated outer membrane protein, partial [Burkholderiaceae bacterium]|nr:TIGR03016 family PEP-CTERM system-associated outer membrane protein [Burkholderiaceae bacterium]